MRPVLLSRNISSVLLYSKLKMHHILIVEHRVVVEWVLNNIHNDVFAHVLCNLLCLSFSHIMPAHPVSWWATCVDTSGHVAWSPIVPSEDNRAGYYQWVLPGARVTPGIIRTECQALRQCPARPDLGQARPILITSRILHDHPDTCIKVHDNTWLNI